MEEVTTIKVCENTKGWEQLGQQKAGAIEYLATIVQSKAQIMAFSDTFIVVGVVALAALIPAAMLSRSQRRSRH